MKASVKLIEEFADRNAPHGLKKLAQLLGVPQNKVSIWKNNLHGLPAAETLKVGLALGYDVLEVLKIIAVEAERKHEGKAYLLSHFGEQVSPEEFGGKGGF